MKLKIKQTFRSMWATILAVLMLLSTFTAVAVTLNVENTGATLDNVTGVKLVGAMNGWKTDNNDYLLSKVGTDSNHYKGTFFLSTNTDSTKGYSFKLRIQFNNNSWEWKSNAKSFNSDYTGGQMDLTGNDNDMNLTVVQASTGFVKLECEFYGNYDGNSYLTLSSTAVSALGGSISVSESTLNSGSTATITSSPTGGSGQYNHSYKVMQGTTDVTSSVLSGTTFTAPTVSSTTTYTITDTVTDSNSKLSGLASKELTTTITVNSSSKTYYVFGGVSSWTPGETDKHIAINTPYNGEEGKFYGIIPIVSSGTYFAITDGTNQYAPEINKSKPDTDKFVNTIIMGYQSWQADKNYEPLYVIIDTTGTGNPTVKFATSLTSTYNVKTSVKLSNNGSTYTEDTDSEKAPTGGGDITGTATLEAKEISGYTFVGWASSADDTITSTSTTLEYTPTANTTVYALYNKNYTVTKAKSVNGDFTVSGLTADGKAYVGSTVTVTPAPAAGYELDTITVRKDVGGTPSTVDLNENSFTMPDGDVTITVTFKKRVYNMTGAVAEGSPAGAGVTSNPTTASIGDQVTFTVTSVEGYNISDVAVTGAASYDISNDKQTVTVIVGSQDVTVTATYTAKTHSIEKMTVTTDGCSFTVATSADFNSTVTIVAHPKDGYKVVENGGVTVTIQDGAQVPNTVNVIKDSENNYHFVMPDGDVQVSVTFTEKTYNVNKGPETNGTFNVSPASAKMGETITVEPTASKGYKISEVSYTDTTSHTIRIGDDGKYTFAMPASDVTVNVTFAPQVFAIETTSPQNGSLTVAPGTSAEFGATVTVTAEPTTGYQLSKITVTKTGESSVIVAEITTASGSFTMPAFPVTITAEFTVSKGTLKSDYRVLYASNTSTQSLTAITANVYQTKENGRDRFTGYIEDSTALSNIATDTTISLGISSSSDYKGLLNRSNSQSASTDTPEYVRNIEPCVDYHDGAGNFRVKFSLAPNKNYSLITITNYDYKYKVNAYVGTPSSTYTLTATVNDPTMGTATVRKTTDATGSPSITVDPNTSVKFEATPKTGYIFDGWYNGGTKESSLATYDCTPTGSLTLQARFKSESSGKIYVKSATKQSISTNYSELTNLVELTSNDGGKTYTGTASLVATEYFLAIYDKINSNSSMEQSGKDGYYFTGEPTKIGTEQPYYTYGNNYNASPLKDSYGNIITAGSYKFTWTPTDNGTNRGTLLVEESTNEFITGATISIDKSTIDLNDSATITVNATPIEGFNGNRTYNLVDVSTGSTVQSVDTSENTATFTVAPPSAGNYNYKVIISTTVSDGGGNSYSPFTTESVTLTVNTSTIYYANTGTGTPGTATATTYNFETGLGSINLSSVTAGNSYTFSLFTSASSKDVDHSVNYSIDTSALKNVKMTAGSLEDGTPTYTVTLNTSCTGLNVYFDSSTSKIWATATYNESLGKTFDSNKEIKYYFAEPTDNTDLSLKGAGVKIEYWNNSCTGQKGTVEVTTPVNVKVNDSDSNTITVHPEKFYNSPASWNGAKTFNVYSVDLPVWATSFKFLDTSNNAIKSSSNSTSSIDEAATYALNPNRIYCLYKVDSTYYTKGVVLDESFWTNTSRTDNEVNTKAFTSHLVDYKNEGEQSKTLNEALSDKYGTSYLRPLYVGNFFKDPSFTLNNFKKYYNLAQSGNNDSYYASIRNLVNSQLNTISEQSGFYQLTNYDSSDPQPLFDYGNMGNDIGTVYNNVDFPLYESSFDGVTTYSYDSTTDANRKFDTASNSYSVKAGDYALGKDADNILYTGFFPFGGNNDYYSNTGFGTELDINFYMTDTGYLKGTTGNKDIAFNFSGDDDVWVFVDGVKVLDLGGDHKISAGSINFSDMKVYYKSASIDAGSETLADGLNKGSWSTNADYVSTVDLGDLMSAYGVDFSKTDSSTQHTLQMFYMERGAFQSNMSVSFNLPQNTGLRVNNTVNTNSVNEGLKDAALNRANADYFSYGISNALATDTDLSALAKHFGVTSLPSAATASSFSEGSFTSAIPEYPMNTTSTVVRRKIGATEYFLTAPSMTGSSSTYYWNELTSSSFIPLNNINYSLADYYAAIDKVNGAETDKTDGSTEASGRVTSGIFNLLFNESATFDSKIPSNTLVKLYQSNQLAYVSAGNGTDSVISKGDNSRKVSDYYTTNYKIVDDDSGKTIGSAEGTLGSTGDVYADDASSTLENSFYFANYSGDSSSSSNAVTIDYENVVQTGNIKVSKSVSDGNASPTDLFYFTLKFRNVFGAGATPETEYKDYKDLTYKVYNNSSEEPVTTRTYGSAGIYLLANQYAVIEGVPVGTEYQITEKERSGYKFVSASGSVVLSDGTPLNSVTQPTSKPLDRNISGSIPNVLDAKNNVGTVNTVAFTNSKVPFTITFKYYDHQVVNGQPANINTTPTTFSVSLETIPEKYLTFDGSGNQTGIKFSDLIFDCYYGKVGSASPEAAGTRLQPKNVIDDYLVFTSQSDAVDSVKNEVDYQNGGKKYSETYTNDEQLARHFDYYGRTSANDDYSVTDTENWVTYYTNGGKTVDETTACASPGNTISGVSVWLFNRPVTYTLTFVTPDNGTVTEINGHSGYYAGNTTNGSNTQTAFYNMRLGTSNTEWKNNLAGAYLNAYGITKGYTGSYPSTPETATGGGKTLSFLYWSYDKEGYEIASTDRQYGYRITSTETLYAIYGDKDSASIKKSPGLSLNAVQPDYYIDGNGIQRTRLNTVMNVYNCDSNDKNIKQAAVIYVQDNTVNGLNSEQLNKVSEDIKNKIATKSKGTAVNFVVTVESDNHTASGFVYDIVSYGSEASAYEAVLTNKNRLQFSNGFKSASLISIGTVYAFAGMNYQGTGTDGKEYNNWIMADNAIKYSFTGENVITTTPSSIVIPNS